MFFAEANLKFKCKSKDGLPASKWIRGEAIRAKMQLISENKQVNVAIFCFLQDTFAIINFF